MQVAITTGKSRGPWIDQIDQHLPNVPGVFLQGCLLLDKEGHTIDEEPTSQDIITRVIDFAEEHNVTLAAYCGTHIYANQTNEYTDRIVQIKEVEPEGTYPALLVCSTLMRICETLKLLHLVMCSLWHVDAHDLLKCVRDCSRLACACSPMLLAMNNSR